MSNTLTGEIGNPGERVVNRPHTVDRDLDCVPEIDDAHLPAMLAVPMARDLGVSVPTVFAAFSAALLVSAALGPQDLVEIYRTNRSRRPSTRGNASTT